MSEMIRSMLEYARRAGVSIPDDASKQIEVAIRAEFGGERVYIQQLPKQKRLVQIARLNRKLTREIVAATGIPERSARRLLKGK